MVRIRDIGSSDDADVTQEGSTLSITFRSLPGTLGLAATNPTVWVIVALTGMSIETVANLLEVKSPIAILIDDYLFQTVLVPIGEELFVSGLQIVTSAIVIAFGTDRQVGVTPGSTVGVADVPLAIFSPLILAIYQTGLAVFAAVQGINQTIAQGLPALGVGAPILVNLLLAAELTVLGYVFWVLITFIPGVNAASIILAVTSLPRRFLRRLL